MKIKILVVAMVMFSAISSARGWNCSNPLASRVPVPAGTTGSFGDGDGQLFLGTGTEGVKGQLYECKVPTTTPPQKTKGDPIYQNQTQTSSSNSNSNSSSGSTSTSNATATGGTSSSTATGGSSTSTGGSSVLKNSGNSAVTNSGNSSNTNNNSAQGGTANNNSSGNSSTYDSSTVVEASKIPVATALAVAPPATSPCVVGFGGGVQTMAFGGGISGGKIDKNCAVLETARSFASMNARLAYCKTMVSNKLVQKAGVTLNDCMWVPPAVILPAVPAPPAIVPPTPVIINLPPQAATIPAPVAPVVRSVGTWQDLGTFKVVRSYSTNLCPTVQVVLGPNGVRILNRAIALNGEVTLIGNVYTTAVATSYLRKHGVTKVVIRAADEQDNSVGVQIWTVE